MTNLPKKGKKGFTLLELLISAAVFAIAITIGVDLFFTVVKVQTRTSYVQTLQNDARYVLEIMAREIRMGNIDYAYYADPDRDPATNNPILFKTLRDPAGGVKLLVTRDQDNNQYFFERVAEGTLVNGGGTKYVIKTCSVIAGSTDLVSKCDGRLLTPADYSAWDTITPKDIQVDRLLFFIKPEVDPFTLNETLVPPNFNSNEQPLVTMVLQTLTDRKEKSYQISTKLQTTISSRTYVR